MNADPSPLKNKDLQIIFAYSPTGFGHLRVMDALQHGLPPGVESETFGADEASLGSLYRLISINPPLRVIYESLQAGWIEGPFTSFYSWVLRTRPFLLYLKLKTLINRKRKSVKEILFVATHFGLAHKLGAIKEQLEKETGVKITLVVVVTDDSPQKIWYVPEADMIFAPSHATCESLIAYAKKRGFYRAPVVFNPYPVTPSFSKPLSEEKYKKRLAETDPDGTGKVQVGIPISGAAVGTKLAYEIITGLHSLSDRFAFHIICKEAPYTLLFLHTVSGFRYVDLHSSYIDRRIVDLYEEAYKHELITLEVTKPSEQAFKALLNPTQVGGAILLLTQPVGRQEYDNLSFLRRHLLIPDKKASAYLHTKARHHEDIDDEYGKQLFNDAVRWRGVELPKSPKSSTVFINWLLKKGFFKQMVECCIIPDLKDPNHNEVDPDGVEKFWEKTEQLLKDK